MGDVNHRDVFFFPGYDIFGVRRYHKFLVRQCGWYGRRFGVRFEVGPLRVSEMEAWLASDVTAHWPDGVVTTRFYFCNWRKDVLRDYSPPPVTRYARMLATWARLVVKGHAARLWRASPRILVASMLPVFLTILRGAAILLALWAMTFGILPGLFASILAAGALYGLWRLGEASYEMFFTSSIVYLERQLYYGGEPDGGRLGVALRSLATRKSSDAAVAEGAVADETLVVGHSYGGAPAMEAAEAMARSGDPVSLLTLGTIAPFVTLDPQESRLRPVVTSLLQHEEACWRDYYAPQDTLSFPQVHPIRDFHLPIEGPPKADFKVRSAIFGKIVAPRKIRKFRWNLLRMHFQFIMAADVQGGYDWIRFALGPDRLKDASP